MSACDRCGRDDWTLEPGQLPARHDPPITPGTFCNNCSLFIDKYGEVDWDTEDTRDPITKLIDYAETGVTMDTLDDLIDEVYADLIDDVLPKLRLFHKLQGLWSRYEVQGKEFE